MTPTLVVDDASAAIRFYMKAFGAKEILRSTDPGGRIMHAELEIGDSKVFLSDENPEMGLRSAKALGPGRHLRPLGPN